MPAEVPNAVSIQDGVIVVSVLDGRGPQGIRGPKGDPGEGLSSEQLAVINAVASLPGAVSAEATARAAADSAEATARAAAVSAEASARATADTTERNARIAADNAEATQRGAVLIEIQDHEADTTGVHGIADTALVAKLARGMVPDDIVVGNVNNVYGGMGFAQDPANADIVYLAGGWLNAADATLPVTINGLEVIRAAATGYGSMSPQVLRWDMSTNEFTVVCNIPSTIFGLDDPTVAATQTWNVETQALEPGLFASEGGGGAMIGRDFYFFPGDNNLPNAGAGGPVVDAPTPGSPAHANDGGPYRYYCPFALKINVDTGVITRLADRPVPSEYTSPNAPVLDGKIYLKGDYSNVGGAATRIDIYDVETDTWTQSAEQIDNAGTAWGTAETAMVAHAGKIYVLSGWGYSYAPGDYEAGITNASYAGSAPPMAYDPDTDTWTELAASPTLRSSSVALDEGDGNLLLIAGYGEDPQQATYRYNVADDSWTTVDEYEITTLWRNYFAAAFDSTGALRLLGGQANSQLDKVAERLGAVTPWDVQGAAAAAQAAATAAADAALTTAVGNLVDVVTRAISPGGTLDVTSQTFYGVKEMIWFVSQQGAININWASSSIPDGSSLTIALKREPGGTVTFVQPIMWPEGEQPEGSEDANVIDTYTFLFSSQYGCLGFLAGKGMGL